MTHVAAITPTHRRCLRQLKADFDAAYSAIDDLSERESDSLRNAEALFRAWIKAIDRHALALLDDLDALDIEEGDRSRATLGEGRGPRIEPIPSGSIEHMFRGLDDALHVPELVGTPGDQTDGAVGT